MKRDLIADLDAVPLSCPSSPTTYSTNLLIATFISLDNTYSASPCPLPYMINRRQFVAISFVLTSFPTVDSLVELGGGSLCLFTYFSTMTLLAPTNMS